MKKNIFLSGGTVFNIRARQGHSDNDDNEKYLISFLDFRGWYRHTEQPFPELKTGCVWVAFKLENWKKIHRCGIWHIDQRESDKGPILAKWRSRETGEVTGKLLGRFLWPCGWLMCPLE